MRGATVIDTTRVLCALVELETTGCREFRLGGGEADPEELAARYG